MITCSDRKKYSALIDEAIENGAKQKLACELVGISSRSYQRWNQGEALLEDQRIHNDAPVHNKLAEAVRHEILEVINKPEHSTLTPYQIVPTLLDAGQYIASESTFYRIMRAHNQLAHRGKGKATQRKKPETLKASKANEIYSWDITYLLSPIKGQYYYFYLVTQVSWFLSHNNISSC